MLKRLFYRQDRESANSRRKFFLTTVTLVIAAAAVDLDCAFAKPEATESQGKTNASNAAPNAALATTAAASKRFKLSLSSIATGYNQPRQIIQSPGENATVYILERNGRVVSLDPDESKRSVLVDLSEQLVTSGDKGGLLGLAFHPNFAENGLVYISYTTKNRTNELRVSEFTVVGQTINIESERKLLRIQLSEISNLGGALAFGPDNQLYIGIGDASGEHDPQERGQNRHDLYGVVLRITPEADADKGKDFIIPKDNPYVTSGLGSKESWIFGLRSPESLSFDNRTNRLWVGDAGAGLQQEINLASPGGNYGWAAFDGTECLRMRFECLDKSFIPPVAAYGGMDGGAITVGPTYYGASLSSISGLLLFGDANSGRLWGLNYNAQGSSERKLLLETGKGIRAIAADTSDRVLIADSRGGEIFELKQEEEIEVATPVAPKGKVTSTSNKASPAKAPIKTAPVGAAQ